MEGDGFSAHQTAHEGTHGHLAFDRSQAVLFGRFLRLPLAVIDVSARLGVVIDFVVWLLPESHQMVSGCASSSQVQRNEWSCVLLPADHLKAELDPFGLHALAGHVGDFHLSARFDGAGDRPRPTTTVSLEFLRLFGVLLQVTVQVRLLSVFPHLLPGGVVLHEPLKVAHLHRIVADHASRNTEG